jgi:transposase-like protein
MPRVFKKQRRIHSAKFKEAAVARMKGCDSVVGLAQELGVNWRLLYRWKDQSERQARALQRSAAKRRVTILEGEVARLKTALAEKVLEADFFERALQKVEAYRQQSGGVASTTKSGK